MVHVTFSRRAFLLSSLPLLAISCQPSAEADAPRLRAATRNTTLGPGDVFRMEIVGEKDLPTEFQVAADGTVSFPYIHDLNVAGLEPQDLAKKIRSRLMEEKILTDPSVVVTVTEYRSKTVTVLGQVQKPGSFPLSPGMTLLQAVSMAGGFTSIAQKSRVNLNRVSDGKAETVIINVELIYEGTSDDILLQSGDTIYVNERVF